MEPRSITVGELRKALLDYPDDTKLYFGYGDLSYHRIRSHGGHPALLQLEFNEIYDTQKKADLVD
jgi:hypothetical protein